MEENIEHKHDEGSCCGCEPEHTNMEEVVSGNAFVLNTLIDLLIEKNIFTEEELTKKLEESQKEIEDSMEETDEENESNEEPSSEETTEKEE